MAPMSMACVPSHTRCELMRVSSFSITRIHCAFGGISSPSNFSTASAVAEVVGHGAEIVDAVGQRHDLLVELGLAGLLDAGVQIADVGHDPHDGLAVDLQQQRRTPWVEGCCGPMFRIMVLSCVVRAPGLDVMWAI